MRRFFYAFGESQILYFEAMSKIYIYNYMFNYLKLDTRLTLSGITEKVTGQNELPAGCFFCTDVPFASW